MCEDECNCNQEQSDCECHHYKLLTGHIVIQGALMSVDRFLSQVKMKPMHARDKQEARVIAAFRMAAKGDFDREEIDISNVDIRKIDEDRLQKEETTGHGYQTSS